MMHGPTRSVLAVILIAIGSLCLVVAMESTSFAMGTICSDAGCAGRSGDPPTCAGAGGCTANESHDCNCAVSDYDSTKCYCEAS